MKRLFCLASVVLCASVCAPGAPVKDDPAQLPLRRLPQYFNKCRNLDRWLQQGQYGKVIKNGKELLKEFVSEDPYAAWCLAAAYASMEPDPEGAEDYYEEALDYLEKALDWGYRNVQVLETSRLFENLRKDKEKSKRFNQLIEELKQQVKREQARARRLFVPGLKKAISRGTPQPFSLKAKDVTGKECTSADFSGKVLVVVVLRPYHDGVRKALPFLVKGAAYARSNGVAFLGAVYNYFWTPRLQRQAQSFVARHKLTFPCVMVDRAWAKTYGILTLPAYLLVSAKGQVLHRIDGALTEDWKLAAVIDLLKEIGTYTAVHDS